MTFEFAAAEGRGSLLEELARFLDTPLIDQGLTIPEEFGRGYIKGHRLNGSLKVMTHKTVLKEGLILRRIADKSEDHDIAVTFHWYLQEREYQSVQATQIETQHAPYVQVTSANIDYETTFKSGCSNRAVIIVLHPKELMEILGYERGDTQIHNLLPENATYYYDEMLTPKMQQVATELIDSPVPPQIKNLYLEIKAKELIYLILASMLRRNQKIYPINGLDVKSVYLVRDAILSSLCTRPDLKELASLVSMSTTKLSRIFRQVFGYSIYDYYLCMKVKEAANLIIRDGCSVSEAGYSVGFTNLSHFTRVFERYVGMKPKKYSMTENKNIETQIA